MALARHPSRFVKLRWTPARIKDPPPQALLETPNPLTGLEVTRWEVPPPLLIHRSLSNRITNSCPKSSQTRCAAFKFKSEWAETFAPILLFTSLNRKKNGRITNNGREKIIINVALTSKTSKASKHSDPYWHAGWGCCLRAALKIRHTAWNTHTESYRAFNR